MRQWEALPKNLGLTIAADARLADITYDDDQIWEVSLNQGTRPGIAVQTTYGGRVGLASLVPLWHVDEHVIYEHDAYHSPPQRISFSTNYQHITAQIAPQLSLDLHLWVIDSHNLGVLYQLKNHRKQALTLRADVFAHVVAEGAELPIGIVTLSDTGHALYLGEIPDRHPVILLDNAHATPGQSARIGTDVTLKAGESKALAWVHSAQKNVRESIRIGRIWLNRQWFEYLRQSHTTDKAAPRFQTGKPLYDLALAMSTTRLMQSLMPTATGLRLISTRDKNDGYRPSNRQYHRTRSWQGFDAYLLWQYAPSIAMITPDKAPRLLDAFLQLQDDEGKIYLPAHPSTPNIPLMCAPLLAQIAHRLITTDATTHYQRLYPNLWRFFLAWLKWDADGDGIPEWQHERQMNYLGFPTFATGHNWGQALAVECVESPDLITYLIHEAHALQTMAHALKKKTDIITLESIINKLYETLNTTWQETHFNYRDRDTHASTTGEIYLKNAQADAQHQLDLTFDTPQRIMIAVKGGGRNQPALQLSLTGTDANGQQIHVQADSNDFAWQYRKGIYTLPVTLSTLHTLQCQGLSRVYKIDVFTPDYTQLDINGVLPIILDGIQPKHRQALLRLLKDEEHFLRPNGISLLPVQNLIPHEDNPEAGTTIWLYWVVRLAEALLTMGEDKLAVDIVKRILELQSNILTTDQQDTHLGQFYHSEQPIAYGDANHLAGFVPPSLIMQLIGVTIRQGGHEVTIYPDFAWNRSIAVQQFGVKVRRTRKRITIEFASGERITHDAPQAPLTLKDPKPMPAPTFKLPQPPQPNNTPDTSPAEQQRFTIQVDIDTESP